MEADIQTDSKPFQNLVASQPQLSHFVTIYESDEEMNNLVENTVSAEERNNGYEMPFEVNSVPSEISISIVNALSGAAELDSNKLSCTSF